MPDFLIVYTDGSTLKTETMGFTTAVEIAFDTCCKKDVSVVSITRLWNWEKP